MNCLKGESLFQWLWLCSPIQCDQYGILRELARDLALGLDDKD